MKRVGHIFEEVVDPENIRTAIKNAARGKRKRTRVRRILANPDHYAEKVREMLIEGFRPSPYTPLTVRDTRIGKTREILQPRFFPDQIVHWAILQVLIPIMMRGMYAHSCGSIPGRGTRHGQRILERWLHRDPKRTKWCLKMDIKQFYPSVSNDLVMSTVQRKIKDPRAIELIDSIVRNAPGLPIGNVMSQWFSNFVLESLDHAIKQQYGARYYVRYVDDLVILGPNKRKLHQIRCDVAAHLEGMGLELKSNWQVFRVRDRGIDFLGYRFFHDRTILRKRNSLRIARRARKIGKKGRLTKRDAAAIVAYWGWLKYSDSREFYLKRVKPHVSIREAREALRREHN